MEWEGFDILKYITLLITPGNQETKAMLIADGQTLAGLYPYMLWTTPGNQETKAMLIADGKHWLGSTPTCCVSHQGIRGTMPCS